MTPRRRTNALQAHSLQCQGLTHRQIGERMQRPPSTVAGHLKDYETHRDETIQSLAADQLAHSLAGLNTTDPDLHQQHINAARELRLQTDTLDRITDRQQRRHRRIEEQEIADTIRDMKAAEELAETLIKNDLWEDPSSLNYFVQTGGRLPDTPSSDAPRPDAGPRATNTADSTPSLSPHNSATETTQTSPMKPDQHPNKPNRTSQISDKTRSNPIKLDRDPAGSPAKHAKSSSKRRKSKKQRH